MTSKARLFFFKELKNGLISKLSKTQSHYIKNVMRLNPGDKISLFNSADLDLKSIASSKSFLDLNHFPLSFKYISQVPSIA